MGRNTRKQTIQILTGDASFLVDSYNLFYKFSTEREKIGAYYREDGPLFKFPKSTQTPRERVAGAESRLPDDIIRLVDEFQEEVRAQVIGMVFALLPSIRPASSSVPAVVPSPPVQRQTALTLMTPDTAQPTVNQPLRSQSPHEEDETEGDSRDKLVRPVLSAKDRQFQSKLGVSVEDYFRIKVLLRNMAIYSDIRER
jgi:hypothetical protein